MFGKLAAGLGVLVVLVGAGVGGFLMLVSPTELVRSELVRQVKSNTGRDLRIKGGAHFVFYPSIGVALDDVSLSGPPGMAGGPLLQAQQIDVGVALMPLLSQNVQIEHINLIRPVFDLHVDGRGRRNWDFAAKTGTRVRLAVLGAGLGDAAGVLSDAGPGVRGDVVRVALPAAAGGALLDNLELRSVRLTKAVIRYRDDQTGATQQVDELDLQLNGRRLSDPLDARGALVWQKERFKFDARLDTVAQLLADRVAKARVTLSGRPASAGFDGTVKLGKAPAWAGQTRLSGDSLASAARFLGLILPNAGPLGGFQVSGRLIGGARSARLNNASISLGETRATGVVRVEMRPKRPYVDANLKMSKLDIDRLSAGFAGARALPRPARRATPKGKSGRPKSIEDLLRRSQVPGQGAGRFAPQVRGFANRNEWSSQPIDIAAFGAVDAKARLRIDGLKVANLAIGNTSLRLALANRVARVDIDDIKLYGGGGKGVITARPTGRGVGIGANLRVDRIAARALLKDAADFDRIDGRGDLELIVSGAGNSQKAIANSLNGTARFAFRDGAIVGWNIAKIIRGLQQGQFSNFDAVSSERTDFSELASSFTITNGIATTRDLRMTSPLLRVAGDGEVRIGARNLNLALRPRLVSSLRGQGGRSNNGGLEIPVKLKGPWHDPRIVPDVKGLTEDPGRLIDQAKKLGKQFKGKSVGDIVRGVLGQSDEGGEQQSGNVKPKELLKQLFR
ncbi:MAG: AsmA family protein [Hyphomicrobiaceae bacterium]